jgi:hypothetical protein
MVTKHIEKVEKETNWGKYSPLPTIIRIQLFTVTSKTHDLHRAGSAALQCNTNKNAPSIVCESSNILSVHDQQVIYNLMKIDQKQTPGVQAKPLDNTD